MSDELELIITAAGAGAQETAAMIAAVEQFLQDTAPEAVPEAAPRPSAWKRAALAEGVSRQPDLSV